MGSDFDAEQHRRSVLVHAGSACDSSGAPGVATDLRVAVLASFDASPADRARKCDVVEDFPFLPPWIAPIAAIVDAHVNPSDENTLEAKAEILTWGFAKPIATLSSLYKEWALADLESPGSLLAGILAKSQSGSTIATRLLGAAGKLIEETASEDLTELVHFLSEEFLKAKIDLKSFIPNGFLDPSGTVVDTNGNPVSGATVTVLRSTTAPGPYVVVSSSSSDIEPATNPETTAADGVFHWDVTSAFYDPGNGALVRGSPNHGASSVTIGPYAVPPPRIGADDHPAVSRPGASTRAVNHLHEPTVGAS